MKAYLPYTTIAGACLVFWVVIKFGTSMIPAHRLPAVNTLPLPDRILEIELREDKPSLPIRTSAFLSPKKTRTRTGSVIKGLDRKGTGALQERFALQAIVVDGERRFASIDGYSIVGEGDPLEEYTVIAIGVDAVRLMGPKGEEVLVFQDVK